MERVFEFIDNNPTVLIPALIVIVYIVLIGLKKLEENKAQRDFYKQYYKNNNKY